MAEAQNDAYSMAFIHQNQNVHCEKIRERSK